MYSTIGQQPTEGVPPMIPYLVPAGRLDEAPAPRPYPEALAQYAVGMVGHLPVYKVTGHRNIVDSAYAKMSAVDRADFDRAFAAEFERRNGRPPYDYESPVQEDF
jgi:hypothetical protein